MYDIAEFQGTSVHIVDFFSPGRKLKTGRHEHELWYECDSECFGALRTSM
jgi:hypothetical protein